MGKSRMYGMKIMLIQLLRVNIFWVVIRYCRIFARGKEKVEGNGIVPFFYSEKRCITEMVQSAVLHKIQDFIETFIEQWPEVFLVDLTTSSSNKITVLLDADNGMNIARCAALNRSLYKYVENENLFGAGNFSIEVSSPGIDRPLTSIRQYRKNIGRNLEVVTIDESRLHGNLIEVNETGIVIEVPVATKKKISETKTIEIPFAEIRQAKVLVTF